MGTPALMYAEKEPPRLPEKSRYELFMEFLSENNIEISEDMQSDTLLFRVPRKKLTSATAPSPQPRKGERKNE